MIQGAPFPSDHVFAGLREHDYRCVLIDPPTQFVAGTAGRPQHYSRMSDTEIAALPVADLLHPDGAWIFLWATSPKFFPRPGSKLLSPADLARAWGAEYSARAFVWVKTRQSSANGLLFGVMQDDLHMGLGYTTRKNAEDVFLFRVGKPKRAAADVEEIIFAPVRQHSRKPEEAIERIERFCEGPRVELFARTKRPGWDIWGLETGKFRGAA